MLGTAAVAQDQQTNGQQMPQQQPAPQNDMQNHMQNGMHKYPPSSSPALCRG